MAKDKLTLADELDVCRRMLAKTLKECDAADDSEAELLERSGAIFRQVSKIKELVWAIVKIDKARSAQISKTEVVTLAVHVADVAAKYVPKTKLGEFRAEVESLLSNDQ